MTGQGTQVALYVKDREGKGEREMVLNDLHCSKTSGAKIYQRTLKLVAETGSSR